MLNNKLNRRLSVRSDDELNLTIQNARMHIVEANKEKVSIIDDSNEDNIYEEFVKSRFSSVECSYFKIDKKNSTATEKRCFCGEIKGCHRKDEAPYNFSEEWNQKDCMRSFPTEAFGQIEFIGEDTAHSKPTEFVRMSHKDNMDDVMDLLFKYWKINIGSLCISVIGGAKNMKMSPKDKDVFTQGLVKAAQTTNALILTSGLNLGITRVVGDAVQEGHTLHFDRKIHKNSLCCLGISPWGYVMMRDCLEKANGGLVKYKVSNEIRTKQPVSLNKNHTHYLFVDEGRRNGFANTEAGNFRASLEKDLAQKKGDREAIPVVLVIVEGGHDVFHEASRSVKENVPLVICDGTGRASDVLGEAYRMIRNVAKDVDGYRRFPESFVASLKKKLIDQKISEKTKADQAIGHIETIVQNESLITLFDMKTTEDLDLAILYSLIKKMKDPRAMVQTPVSNQIQLCLTWNRVDIAKEKIFKDNVELTVVEWNKLLDTALKNGKYQFVELFLQNGACINEYLTTSTLNDLYGSSTKRVNFEQTVQFYLKAPFSNGLEDVAQLLVKMVGRYKIQTCENADIFPTETTINKLDDCKDFGDDKFQHPFQELFLWAILMEKYECAKLFWERCEESILLSIVATMILLMIERGTTFQETDRIEMLVQWKDYYENIAIKVLEEIHELNRDYAAYLIEKKNHLWGGLSCLELAHRANDQRFISSMVCQNSIDFTWRSGLKVGFPRCVFALFCPYLILNSQTNKREDVADAGKKYRETMPNGKKLKIFYTAPQTKFWMHLIMHIMLLFYSSAIVLSLMKRNKFTIHEIFFMAYLIVLLVDRIIQVFRFQPVSSRSRFIAWWEFSWWNKIDCLLIVATFVVIFLRVRRHEVIDQRWVLRYRSLKTIYSIIVGYFYLKLLRFIIIHPNLGPKMVMIAKMIRELMLYLVIVIIILLAYGVTSQASYYPERIFHAKNLSSIVDTPYWTLFGELSLDQTVYLPWCDDSATNFTGPNDCPEFNVVIPMIYAIYIFVGNILLLNVLIAIFSNIFNDVQKNSIIVWKFNMYSLVLDYKSKTSLPTPFSLIFYFVSLVRYLYRKQCCNLSQGASRMLRARCGIDHSKVEDSDCKDTGDSEEHFLVYQRIDIELIKFEKCCQTSIVNTDKLELESMILKMDEGLKKLTVHVGKIGSKIDRLHAQGTDHRTSKRSGPDDKQISLSRDSSQAEDNSMSTLMDELRQIKEASLTINQDLITRLQKNREDMKNYFVEMTSKVQNLDEEMIDAMTSIRSMLSDQYRQPIMAEHPIIESRWRSRDLDLRMILTEINNRDSENKARIRDLDMKIDNFGRTMESSMKTFEFLLRSILMRPTTMV